MPPARRTTSAAANPAHVDQQPARHHHGTAARLGERGECFTITIIAIALMALLASVAEQCAKEQRRPRPTGDGSIVTTESNSEYLHTTRRNYDNRSSATPNEVEFTIESTWTREFRIDSSFSTEAEADHNLLIVAAGAKVRSEFRFDASQKQVSTFRDVFRTTAPARTNLTVIFKWKREWRNGYVRIPLSTGTTVDVPFAVADTLSYDTEMHTD